MYLGIICDLFIASSSDCKEAKPVIAQACYEWNQIHGHREGVFIQPRFCEVDGYPALCRPQDQLNKVLDKCDIAVALVWYKFANGLREELERSIQQQKKLLVYFSEKGISPKNFNEANMDAIENFKGSHQENAYWWSYESDEQLAELFKRQLQQTMNSLLESDIKNFQNSPETVQAASSVTEPPIHTSKQTAPPETITTVNIAQLPKPAIEILAACLRKGQLVYTNNQQFVFAGTSQTFVSELPEGQQQDTNLIVKTLIEQNLFVAEGTCWKASELAQKYRQEILQVDFWLCVASEKKPNGFIEVVKECFRTGNQLCALPYNSHGLYKLELNNVELKPLLSASDCDQLFNYLEKRDIIRCERSFEYNKEQMTLKKVGTVTPYGQTFSHRWQMYVYPQFIRSELANNTNSQTTLTVSNPPRPDILSNIPENVLEWLVEIYQNKGVLYKITEKHQYWDHRKYILKAKSKQIEVDGESPDYGYCDRDIFEADVEKAKEFFNCLKPYLYSKDETTTCGDRSTQTWRLNPKGHQIAEIAIKHYNM